MSLSYLYLLGKVKGNGLISNGELESIQKRLDNIVAITLLALSLFWLVSILFGSIKLLIIPSAIGMITSLLILLKKRSRIVVALIPSAILYNLILTLYHFVYSANLLSIGLTALSILSGIGYFLVTLFLLFILLLLIPKLPSYASQGRFSKGSKR
jgi:hypothetical protein